MVFWREKLERSGGGTVSYEFGGPFWGTGTVQRSKTNINITLHSGQSGDAAMQSNNSFAHQSSVPSRRERRCSQNLFALDENSNSTCQLEL